VLGEPLTPVIALSFALILSGSVLAARAGKGAAQASVEASPDGSVGPDGQRATAAVLPGEPARRP
jgi:hypothetical protein